ncbi:MAG TPA: efflux RND transporter periplasmic adaptor subunit [Blastocatellia bacterium]|nr:efflux RND transporter periplasmic adaptor subunit [Blastocatellia bacterium]
MDIPRQQAKTKRAIKRIAYGVLALVAIGVITVGVSRLQPAAPTVDAPWKDTVKRGPMLRQVGGIGTLVPEDIRWIPAASQGRVERILVKPADVVSPATVLVELSNPELQQSLLEAEQQTKAAEAELNSLKARLNNELLNQKAQAATVQADYKTAKLQADVNVDLKSQGLVSDLQLKLSQVRAEELATRNELEGERLETNRRSATAQIDQQQARVDSARALLELRRSQVHQLNVTAGMSGVVQVVPIQVGQQVRPGENLARVADPLKLKAELRIPDTQTRDLEIGQKASVDTRNGVIQGRVSRIDPASTNGSVIVDVALEGELPKGARPDLTVDGRVELERLDNILYVGRPVHGGENANIMLFKVEPGTNEAVRTPVRLGKTSVNTVEVLDGLKEGDVVILSDMSAYDTANRVRLN